MWTKGCNILKVEVGTADLMPKMSYHFKLRVETLNRKSNEGEAAQKEAFGQFLSEYSYFIFFVYFLPPDICRISRIFRLLCGW